MNLIYETTVKITAFDVDVNGRLRIQKVFDFFQDAASMDAERLGFGYSEFMPKGLFWVLSWIKIEFLNHPKFMDEVKIQTWGKKQHKLFSLRDFIMLNRKDEIIIKGTSAWLLLNLKSRRPKLLTQLFPNVIRLETKEALSDLPYKVIPPKEMKFAFSKTMRFSDIDLNNHTNNAKYIELMMDCFDINFHKLHSVKSLTASFNAETKYSDEIELFVGSTGKNIFADYVEGKNKKSGVIAFQGSTNWLTEK